MKQMNIGIYLQCGSVLTRSLLLIRFTSCGCHLGTGDQAKIMKKLKEDFIKEEIAEDTSALHGMQMRLRFNSDMFQHICLVRTVSPITAEDLDEIVAMKHSTKELMDFLNESTIVV